jgi:acyl transferase domain-containing protein/non-ribosomal peptide synthetase component F
VSQHGEPIGIVGLACRVPGADDADAFWRILLDGVDSISEVPPERYDVSQFYADDATAPGKICTRWGGFLAGPENSGGFDAAFFGISPREAAHIDPQQRLVLELAFRALEDAGMPLDRVRGRDVGVFIGAMWNEFAGLVYRDARAIAQHSATGCDNSIIAGRVSYWLDAHGPSLTVNTGCSSSLVAVHLAAESVRRGESALAIAGGVNLLLSPETTVGMSKLGVLSPTGRCRAFDASADGYVRSEGGGLVVLKPLSAARRDRDRVYATILGSATNNDGTTAGLTAPNANAQAAVIRTACARSGVSPGDLDYVEAHGTGTALGDRIEAQALGVCRRGLQDDAPLAVGSVKTNIGHLEGAAGVTGLIKTALALHHRRIPANLHFNQPNPKIEFETLGLSVVDRARDWPGRATRPGRAGVSSFGFGGTNCHVVLEATPDPRSSSNSSNSSNAAESSRAIALVVLSARSPEALDAQAAGLHEFVARSPQVDVADLAFSLATARTAFEHRLALTAHGRDELLERLSEVVGGIGARATRGFASSDPPKTAFLYTGQGAQYLGMGRGLYKTFPVFRDALDRSAAVLDSVLEKPLLDVMFAPEGTRASLLLNRTEYAQPALFALEWALTELWRSVGIIPDVVLGHSLGEYVAASVAGVFSVETGLRLAALRGRLMQATGDGAMVSCSTSADEIATRIRPWTDSVSIAAVNGEDHVVISGRREAIEALAASLAGDGITTTALQVSHGFHSPLMDGVLDELETLVSDVDLREPRLPLVSNLTGRVSGDVATAAYWRRHAREPVYFAECVKAAAALGVRAFVELGPRPVLLGMGARTIQGRVRWLPSLRRSEGTGDLLLSSLGQLFADGSTVNWSGVFDVDTRRRVALPFYPFQRVHHERTRDVPAERPRTGTTLSERVAAAHPDQRLEEIRSEVRLQVARIVDLDPTSSLLDGPFTGLGLDSLMALQARNALAAELDRPLAPTVLFEHDTIETLSRHLLDCWHASPPDTSQAEIAAEEGPDPFCLSSGQRRFWFLDQLLSERHIYNVVSVIRIRGVLDRTRLIRSLRAVLRRHEVLRTTFEDDRGKPRITLTEADDFELTLADISGHPDLRDAIHRFANQFGSRPFDLGREIPVRAALLELDGSSAEPEHALVIVWHHIAIDAWSQAIFRRDLRAAYRAGGHGQDVRLPNPAFQHADAARWEARWLQSAAAAADRAFWVDTLKGMPLVNLPTTRTPPAERSSHGGSVPFTWPADLTDALKGLATKTGSTVFQVLAACYVALLHRLSGQTDIGIGTIFANRDSTHVRDLIGPFVNTVVLRCRLDGDPEFSDLIGRVRSVARTAFEHGHLPFDEVVRATSGGHTAELNPLFRHSFALQNIPIADGNDDTEGLSWIEASPNPAGALEGTAKFDLNLVMVERAERLEGIFEYSADLFDRPAIEGISAMFERMARDFIANPHGRVSGRATTSSDGERTEQVIAGIWADALGHTEFGPDDDFFTVGGHSLLVPQIASSLGRAFGRRFRLRSLFQHRTITALAREVAGHPGPTVVARSDAELPLHQAFEARLERQPNSIALTELGGTSIAYEGLARRAAAIEARLRNLGIGPGSLVGISLNRSIDYVAAVLGALRTGAAFIPAPASDPTAHRATLLAFAGVQAVVRADGIHPMNPAIDSREGRLRPGVADDPCVVLTSSGSTGQPKLVVRSHRSFFHRIAWTHRLLPPVEGDVCVLKAHPTTTHAIYELFEPLLAGIPTVIVPDEIARDVEAFWEQVEECRVTRLLIVPSFMRASLELTGFEIPRRVRVLTLMGEPVDAPLAGRILRAVAPTTAVHSIYGTTEASSVLLCDLRADLKDGRLPLGRPIDPAIEVLVLDEAGAPVARGEEGLLHIRGSALFSGYLHQPDATARALVRHGSDAPIYNTADRVRVDASGLIEYVGRADRAVKIRGFRVDPGEIEQLILQQPGVAAAAVLPSSDGVGRTMLTAFVAPAVVDRSALLERLRASLPPHMVPGRLRVMSELPRTLSGKVDGQALGAMALE